LFLSAKMDSLGDSLVQSDTPTTHPSNFIEALQRAWDELRRFDLAKGAALLVHLTWTDPHVLFLVLWVFYFYKRIFEENFCSSAVGAPGARDPFGIVGRGVLSDGVFCCPGARHLPSELSVADPGARPLCRRGWVILGRRDGEFHLPYATARMAARGLIHRPLSRRRSLQPRVVPQLFVRAADLAGIRRPRQHRLRMAVRLGRIHHIAHQRPEEKERLRETVPWATQHDPISHPKTPRHPVYPLKIQKKIYLFWVKVTR